MVPDAAPSPIGHNRPARRQFKRVCTECGDAFLADMAHGDFCCAAHRKAFNNRRMIRGAEIYDLVMALRYQRDLATALGVWKLICRLAQGWREEDQAQRAGRHSWRPPQEIIERRPYLRAEFMLKRARKAN